MLDVRIPHVHAPHGEVGGWRGFATHVAVIAVGLLLAFGLERTAEYVQHEIQRATLESQMRETFQSNIRRAERNIQVLNANRAYLIELRDAVASRMAGGTVAPPQESDPRNFVYAPPLNLGSYEASKINGSVGLLGLDRIRLYDRIEFQHNVMLAGFQHFIDAVTALREFPDRLNSPDGQTPFQIPQPDISKMSLAELADYHALLAKMINYNRLYAGQFQNLKMSYQVMLSGTNDSDELMDAIVPQRR